MTPQEAWQLLVLDSTFTGRTVDKMTAITWAEILANVSIADATAALKDYYTTERKWIMPVDIIDRVKAKAKALLPTTMSPEYRDCTQQGRAAHSWMPSGMCVFCTVVRRDR